MPLPHRRRVHLFSEMLLTQDLEQLKRLSLGWMIRKGLSLPEAEDLFQQSLLKALTSEASLENQEKLQSWFMSILKNTLLDYFRSNTLHQKKNNEFQIETELLANNPEIEESFCKCVNGFLGDLPESDQSLLQEHFFEGKSFAALSSEHGTAEGTLRVKALHAREKIKEMFKACCHVRKFNDLKDCGC